MAWFKCICTRRRHFVEINDTSNSTRNVETNYSTVTDPENLQLNQAYLKYVYSPKFDLNVIVKLSI